MTAWGRMLLSAINGLKRENETCLVRMFRIEFSREFQHLEKMGCGVSDDFVKQFLKDRKYSQSA